MYNKVTSKIDSVWSKYEMILVYIGCAAILVAMLLITADVILRNFANKSILGASELVELLLMPMFMCALPYIQRIHNHVILEFATEKAPQKVKLALDIFGMLVGLFLFSSIAAKSVQSAIDSFVRLDITSGAVHFYIWPAKFCLALVVLSLIVRLVLDIFLSVGKLASPSEKAGEEK